MEITEEHRKRIEAMIADMHCSKDFSCYKSDFEKLGQINIFAGGTVVDCLEPAGDSCEYSLSFGKGFLCNCPVRQYLARNLGI